MPKQGEGVPSGFQMRHNPLTQETLRDHGVRVWPKKLVWNKFKNDPHTQEEITLPKGMKPASVEVETLGGGKWGLKIMWLDSKQRPLHTQLLEMKADVTQTMESGKKYYLALVQSV